MKRKKIFRPRHEPEYDKPVWFGLSRSTWLTWLILAVVVFLFFILGVLGFLGKLEFGVIFFFLLIAFAAILSVATFADVKVHIDSEGIRVRCGAFGRPRRSIPWKEVSEVNAIEVDPAKLGGFGYRWIPIKDGTAITMRPGDGLEVKQKNGKRLVVTLDNASDAAAFAQQFVN